MTSGYCVAKRAASIPPIECPTTMTRPTSRLCSSCRVFLAMSALASAVPLLHGLVPDPLPGEGVWYLVGGVLGTVDLSYDTFTDAQHHSRDAEIAASALDGSNARAADRNAVRCVVKIGRRAFRSDSSVRAAT